MNYEKPAQIAETLRTELLHFSENFTLGGVTDRIRYEELSFLSEPFIGYAEIELDQVPGAYLFCRNYTPINFRPADANIDFASYLSPMGQMFVQRPGYIGEVVGRYATIQAKAQFLPVREGKTWEAKYPRISWDNQELSSESLSKLLPLLWAQLQAANEPSAEEPLIPLSLELKARRPVLQVTQLPDRAVLDEVQDPIFRHSITGPILITGAPGTGKTTVQIKRLAQKTKWAFLTNEERVGFDRTTWVDNDGWVFFTPTKLLKGYLKEALAKERLAASDDTVKVWGDYQVELLRRLRFLRVKDTDDTFRRVHGDGALLLHADSTLSAELALAFVPWLSDQIDAHVRKVIGLPENFRHPLGTLASRAAELPNEKRALLGYAHLFRKIPALFAQFRKEDATRKRFYRTDEATRKALDEIRIDPREMSVLLYAALSWVRDAAQHFESDSSANNAGGPSYLLQDQKTLVAIDEASDFSAVEIATMALLADPRKQSLSLSGDLMQRLTSTGLRSWGELALFGLEVPRYELRRAYRQTDRLTRLAGKLYSAFSGDAQTPADSVNPADNDPPVLVRHAPEETEGAEWIAQRIKEIYDLSGGRLPTVGVLLPTEADVEPFTALLREALFDASIDVEASLAGQSLGETNKVRVFCVDHIKGLEFESVFFCDIDVMAEKQGDLIDKFVYVGLSRARSFLGMTYRGAFPPKLDVIKLDLHFAEQFAEDSALRPWRTYLDEDIVAQISTANQALLDQHFEFYWNLATGIKAPESEPQKAFMRFAKSVSDGQPAVPKTEHETAFGAFLDGRTLRGES